MIARAGSKQTRIDEIKIIGARKLHLRPDAVRITPVEEVFAR